MMIGRPSTIGVAPGTTTMQLGVSRQDSCCDPWKPCCDELVMFSGLANAQTPFVERQNHYPIDPFIEWQGRLPLGAIPQARIRWDIVAAIGGGSLVIALAIGLVASALSK